MKSGVTVAHLLYTGRKISEVAELVESDKTLWIDKTGRDKKIADEKKESILGILGDANQNIINIQIEENINTDACHYDRSDVWDWLGYPDAVDDDLYRVIVFPDEIIDQTDEEFNDTERVSLLKMVLGMAMEKYGYVPHKSKNEATGRKSGSIYGGITSKEIGISISDDTIRKFLDLAVEKLKPKQE